MTPLVRAELEKQLTYHRNRLESYRRCKEQAQRTIADCELKLAEHHQLYRKVERQLLEARGTTT
jgi:hypothetical protein